MHKYIRLLYVLMTVYLFLPARRYAIAGICQSNVSVRHEPLLCQNEEG